MFSISAQQALTQGTSSISRKRPRDDIFPSPQIPKLGVGFDIRTGENGAQQFNGNFSGFGEFFRPGKRSRGNVLNGASSLRSSLMPLMTNQGTALGGRGPDGIFAALGIPSFDSVPTMGFLSNYTIPGNMTVIYNEDSRLGLPKLMDLAFFRRQRPSESQRLATTASGMVVDETPRCAYTLPSLNYYLAKAQKKPVTVQEMLGQHPTDEFGLNVHNPFSIMKNFYPAGFINSNETSNNFSVQPWRQTFTGGSGEWHKVGLSIAGRAEAFAMFGHNLKVGVNCFIICKPYRRARAYVVAQGAKGLTAIQFSKNESEELHDTPFQMVPYATMDRVPPLSELEYVADDGSIKRAPFRHVTTIAKQRDPGGGMTDPETAMHDISFIHNQGYQEVVAHV